MFLKDISEFLPMVQKNGIELAIPYLLMKIAKQMQNIDPKTRKKNVKEAIKQFPQSKQMLKDWQKILMNYYDTNELEHEKSY